MNPAIREFSYNVWRKLHPLGELDQLSVAQLEEEDERLYYVYTGKHMDFANPQTFNEKVQWLKIHDATERKTRCADKIAVRDVVADAVGEDVLIPILGTWNSAEDVSLEGLPQRFLLKANHGSSMSEIVDMQAGANEEALRAQCAQWLSTNQAALLFEMHYAGIERKILAEAFVDDIEWEFQAWCFDGEVGFIAAIQDPHGVNEKQFFSPQWLRKPYISSPPVYRGVVDRPQCLDTLLSNSRKLSEGFAHVRIDWYSSKSAGLLFSEMTFAPAAGFIRWQPDEYDRILGAYIKLP